MNELHLPVLKILDTEMLITEVLIRSTFWTEQLYFSSPLLSCTTFLCALCTELVALFFLVVGFEIVSKILAHFSIIESMKSLCTEFVSTWSSMRKRYSSYAHHANTLSGLPTKLNLFHSSSQWNHCVQSSLLETFHIILFISVCLYR